MFSLRWKVCALAAVLSAAPAAAQIGPGPFAAFPSANTTDARFLAFGCPGIATFEQEVTIGLAAPAGEASFVLSIFDGETGETDGGGRAHWDAGTRQLIYSLYADPLRQGNTNPGDLIGAWTGNSPNPTSGPLWTATAADMPDNDWWGVTVTTSSGAQAPSGNYFYNLVIKNDGTCNIGEVLASNIKVASTSPMSFLLPRFGLEAALRQAFNDGPIIYPGPTFPPPGNDFVNAPTTYDGTFTFSFVLPGGEPDLQLYNGDFDHGTTALVGIPSATVLSPCLDTDDPDTPLTYAGFPFSTAGAAPEAGLLPSSPPDDSASDLFRRGEVGAPGRVGCVRYEVIDPNGIVYRDDNPSGNIEWEQFRIASLSAVNPNDSDYVVNAPALPGGLWTVKIVGLDLANLNFWFANTCSISSGGGAACPTASVYLVGDTVWFDADGDGVQDSDEPGISGVVLELLTDIGSPPVQTVVTGDSSSPNWAACVANNTGLDEQGLYCFGVDQPGTYIVRVAAENFQPSGALEGLASTNGGDTQTNSVVDDNELTYDFGYRGAGSIGDRVWLDRNGDGVQDSGEGGINGVTLELLDGGGNVIATTTTSGDGNYTFGHLVPGTYTLRVVAVTLPAGLGQTFDRDGAGTPHTATVTLDPGQDRDDVDFGYRGTASVGDRVWNDLDGDGVQEGGEAGINGVTVELLDGGGNVVDTQMTSGDGNYSFTQLTLGNYTVRVVSSTVPAGFVPTYDLDGTASPHVAAFSLAPGETRDDVDFGYRTPPPCVPGSFKDTFTTNSFSNNDGTLSWTGAWIENDTAGAGVSSGNVTVGTPVSGYMILRDSPDTGTQPSAARQANLSSFASATLTVDFHIRGVEPDDAAVIEVSKDGGATYTVLETLTGLTGTSISSRTYNISAYIASNTRIRFRISNNYGGDDDFFKVDVVRIDGACTSQTGSIGDRLWYDSDGDGVQDAGEPGLGGTKVELLNSGGTVIATTTADSNGIYTFTNLAAGSYTVRVVASTLPVGGLAPTYDLDGTGTPHTATVTLAGAQTRTDVDFGYRGTRTLGDRVWNDADADGIQDGTESGINGVTVRLFIGSTEVASTVTAGNGNYTFTNLPDLTYTVRIDTATLPAGMTPTYDLDGTATPHQATVTLTASRTDVDFGYRTPPVSCTAGSFKDTFTNASFSNNEGTLSWSGAWVENDVAGAGVSSGNVTVGTPVSGYMILNDSPDTGTQPSAARQVNLSAFAAATLTVDFHIRGVESDDAVVIEVSKDGGATYTVLETLTGYTGTYISSRTYNISAYRASNTRIRFRISNNYGGDDDFFKVDQVRIDASCTPPPTCTAGSFKDTFSTASFSNNNGTLSWSGAWIESDTAGAGVSSGNVTVGTPYSGYLILDDNPDTGTQPSAARQANLAGFASATLKFDFHTTGGTDPDDAVVIEVSKNGGSTYTVLETLSGFTGTNTGSRTYNISSYIASNTRIRFRVSNNYGAGDEMFKVDQVRIEAACQ